MHCMSGSLIDRVDVAVKDYGLDMTGVIRIEQRVNRRERGLPDQGGV